MRTKAPSVKARPAPPHFYVSHGRMKRVLPHFFGAGGLILIIIGFTVAPRVPYQDPTPEKSLLAEKQSERLVILGLTGFLFFVTGLLWAIIRWFRSRFIRTKL